MCHLVPGASFLASTDPVIVPYKHIRPSRPSPGVRPAREPGTASARTGPTRGQRRCRSVRVTRDARRSPGEGERPTRRWMAGRWPIARNRTVAHRQEGGRVQHNAERAGRCRRSQPSRRADHGRSERAGWRTPPALPATVAGRHSRPGPRTVRGPRRLCRPARAVRRGSVLPRTPHSMGGRSASGRLVQGAPPGRRLGEHRPAKGHPHTGLPMDDPDNTARCGARRREPSSHFVSTFKRGWRGKGRGPPAGSGTCRPGGRGCCGPR